MKLLSLISHISLVRASCPAGVYTLDLDYEDWIVDQGLVQHFHTDSTASFQFTTPRFAQATGPIISVFEPNPPIADPSTINARFKVNTDGVTGQQQVVDTSSSNSINNVVLDTEQITNFKNQDPQNLESLGSTQLIFNNDLLKSQAQAQGTPGQQQNSTGNTNSFNAYIQSNSLFQIPSHGVYKWNKADATGLDFSSAVSDDSQPETTKDIMWRRRALNSAGHLEIAAVSHQKPNARTLWRKTVDDLKWIDQISIIDNAQQAGVNQTFGDRSFRVDLKHVKVRILVDIRSRDLYGRHSIIERHGWDLGLIWEIDTRMIEIEFYIDLTNIDGQSSSVSFKEIDYKQPEQWKNEGHSLDEVDWPEPVSEIRPQAMEERLRYKKLEHKLYKSRTRIVLSRGGPDIRTRRTMSARLMCGLGNEEKWGKINHENSFDEYGVTGSLRLLDPSYGRILPPYTQDPDRPNILKPELYDSESLYCGNSIEECAKTFNVTVQEILIEIDKIPSKWRSIGHINPPMTPLDLLHTYLGNILIPIKKDRSPRAIEHHGPAESDGRRRKRRRQSQTDSSESDSVQKVEIDYDGSTKLNSISDSESQSDDDFGSDGFESNNNRDHQQQQFHDDESVNIAAAYTAGSNYRHSKEVREYLKKRFTDPKEAVKLITEDKLELMEPELSPEEMVMDNVNGTNKVDSDEDSDADLFDRRFVRKKRILNSDPEFVTGGLVTLSDSDANMTKCSLESDYDSLISSGYNNITVTSNLNDSTKSILTTSKHCRILRDIESARAFNDHKFYTIFINNAIFGSDGPVAFSIFQNPRYNKMVFKYHGLMGRYVPRISSIFSVFQVMMCTIFLMLLCAAALFSASG